MAELGSRSSDHIRDYPSIMLTVRSYAPMVELTKSGAMTVEKAAEKDKVLKRVLNEVRTNYRGQPVDLETESQALAFVKNVPINIIFPQRRVLKSPNGLFVDKDAKYRVLTKSPKALEDFLRYLNRYESSTVYQQGLTESRIREIIEHETAHAKATEKATGNSGWIGVEGFKRSSLSNVRSYGPIPLIYQPIHATEGKVQIWDYVQILLAPKQPSESDYRSLGIVDGLYDLSRMTKQKAKSIFLNTIVERCKS